jgi:ectoine hydroxylase-related dioxygenase (phytanoyl-CoA dioxygenase family)
LVRSNRADGLGRGINDDKTREKSHPASMSQDFKTQVQRDGFAVIPACLDESTLESLSTEFDDSHHPERNLLSIQSVQALATSSFVREIMEAILGPGCFAVRGIFFNKTRTSNWKVAWHQDLTIAVRERKNVEGFGPWTMKAGVIHVQPPCEVIAEMLAARLHLDESGIDNGPLRVIAGSHRKGRLSAEQIANWNKETAVTCTVPKGGALVMRPLLLHASSSCVVPKSRRVIHLEFAAAELAHGLDWHDRVPLNKRIPSLGPG